MSEVPGSIRTQFAVDMRFDGSRAIVPAVRRLLEVTELTSFFDHAEVS